jgi:N-acetylmuramic acid 6-phosphate etherase
MAEQKELTEQRNPKSYRIDTKTTEEILHIINDGDKTIPSVVAQAIPQIANTVEAVVKSFRHDGHLFYIGAGTSGRLGVLDASECPPTYGVSPSLVQGIIAGGDKALRNSIEGAEDDIEQGVQDCESHHIGEKDVIVGISANGGAPYILGALKHAISKGATIAAICCNPDCKIFTLVPPQYRICIPVGPEIITGSTRMKSGTAQKLVLNMITTTAMIKWGKVYDNWMIDLVPVNQKLVHRSLSMIEEITGADEETAEKTFTASGNNVRRSIVMILMDIDRKTADDLLAAHNGNIHSIVDAHIHN